MNKEELKKQAYEEYMNEVNENKTKKDKLVDIYTKLSNVGVGLLLGGCVLQAFFTFFNINPIYSLIFEACALVPCITAYISAIKFVKIDKKIEKLRDKFNKTCEKIDAEVDVEVRTLNNNPKKMTQVVETSNSSKDKTKTDESIK